MKHKKLRKTLYVLICIFLLCLFFSVRPERDPLNGSFEGTSNSASIHVPHGLHMELRNEERNVFSFVNVRERTSRSFSGLRLALLAAMILSACAVQYHTATARCNGSLCRSSLSIIKYIHNKDGRKR